ncbi:hypothetical protein CDES_03795 [Corynebacterium deserti GIMN1.010]|uniref:DUF4259 domain-containing protein n=1 Tax=Corynebacterium deserti GIMN1.010 TaxID=931089 RepID=A0A0M5ILR1_9CORY|nr:hypothetical protein [Corynebacterium deserti]ALC05211.1 hypothetical protein CDES_03795 [Corynebacterium deserti GIMN1.010]
MGAWDDAILTEEINIDFLDEIAELDTEDIIEALEDACLLVVNQENSTEDEHLNGQAAATIAAIMYGAPYSAGQVVENYPFIRDLIGEGTETLRGAAAQVLEEADVEYDLEAYLEALN